MMFRICAAITLVLLAAGPARAQHEVVLFAEPVSGGVQYLAGISDAFRIGATVSAGPLYGVDVLDAPDDDVRNWATAYAAFALRAGGIQLLVNPIGAAVVRGNDFTAVYPSGRAAVELVRGKWRFGSALRVIRIAGTNNTADYWTQWVPVRVGIALTK